MQAGITSGIDKAWTRIYNPGQVAVDRFDPQGQFIQHWVPELRHLRPQQLGSPPVTKGYPAPILDYKQARAQRVEQLQRQRQRFTQHADIVPLLAPLPKSLVPFGYERVGCEVSWAKLDDPSLFPMAIDLAGLDAEQSRILRTWFVSSTEVATPQTQWQLLPSREPEQLTLL